MVIYADVLFIINVLMDTTLIWAAGMLLKEKIRIFRILLGASAGAAMYIASLFFPYSGPVFQILLTVFSIALSVIIAYRPKTFMKLVHITLLTVLLAFIASGAIVSFMVLKTYWTYGNALEGIFEAFSYKILIITSVLFYIVIKTGRKYFIKTASDPRQYCDITVYIDDKRAKLRALADTGNSLKDNLTGKDIIVAEYSAVKKLIPVDTGINDDSVEMFKVLSETDFKNRLRLIPFKSIGNKNGILLGVKADRAEISFQGNRKVEKTEVILCLFSGKMDFDGSFNAIINYEILI